MPRKKNKLGGVDSTVVDFHTVFSGVFAASVFPIVANPAGLSRSGRLLTEADSFAHFRIDALKFRLHPGPTSNTGVQAAGFVGGVQDVLPATVATVGELIPSVCHSLNNFTPTEWVNVPKKDLAGPLPWYKSIAGGVDATEESPGFLCIVTDGGATDPFLIEIRGRVTFKTAVAAANTPASLQARLTLRDERVKAERAAAQSTLRQVLGIVPVPK